MLPGYNGAAGTDWTSNVTNSWQIQNVMVKTDLCTLDNEMDNEFASLLLSGKSLTMTFNTFVSQIQTVLGEKIQVNVSRSLARLDGVFVSLIQSFPALADAATSNRYAVDRKNWSEFISPMFESNYNKYPPVNAITVSSKDLTKFQLQIGSKLFPEYPVTSTAECYYMLKKYLGHRPISIDGRRYRDNQFIIGVGTEKLTNVAFSGINTKSSQITVHMNLSTTDDIAPESMHIVLVNTGILEISDQSVAVYD